MKIENQFYIGEYTMLRERKENPKNIFHVCMVMGIRTDLKVYAVKDCNTHVSIINTEHVVINEYFLRLFNVAAKDSSNIMGVSRCQYSTFVSSCVASFVGACLWRLQCQDTVIMLGTRANSRKRLINNANMGSDLTSWQMIHNTNT